MSENLKTNDQDQPVGAKDAAPQKCGPTTRLHLFVRRLLRLATNCFYINEFVVTSDLNAANKALETHGEAGGELGTSKELIYDQNEGFKEVITYYLSRRTFIPWVFAKNVCNSIREAAVFFYCAFGLSCNESMPRGK